MIKGNKKLVKAVSGIAVGLSLGIGGIVAPSVTNTTPVTTASAASSSYRAALATGYSYARSQHMSKRAVYHQLCSKYGEGFSKHAASYAVRHIHGVSWNKNALKSARSYRHSEHMSSRAIYQQLISSYGDMFTKSQASYAIHHL